VSLAVASLSVMSLFGATFDALFGVFVGLVYDSRMSESAPKGVPIISARGTVRNGLLHRRARA
jgi:hypothetical protein